MSDFDTYQRLHLERSLVVAETSGDEQWAQQVRDELEQYESKTDDAEPDAPSVDDELEQLRAEAEAVGVKVDGRWGVDRLREEIAAAAEDDSEEEED